jgi:hypothetical protein
VSSDLLAAELVRTGAEFTFLRRSFTADMAGRDPFVEVPLLLEAVQRLRLAGPDDAAAARRGFVAAVTGAPLVDAPAPAPALVPAVALPA